MVPDMSDALVSPFVKTETAKEAVARAPEASVTLAAKPSRFIPVSRYGLRAKLIEMLTRYGFEVYTMSSLSMREKAQLLSSARIIVGPHGSGSVNFAFCKPGTKIIDLFPGNCVAPFICDVCDKRGLVYDYLLCESDGNATNAVEGQKLNLTVDVNQVEEKVRRLLTE